MLFRSQSWHNIEKIMAGGLDPIVEALQEAAEKGTMTEGESEEE